MTAAWATSVGLVDISNEALLYRLRRCEIVGAAGGSGPAPKASRGPLDPDRRHDGAKKGNQLWRIHSTFDLAERFGHFELTDQQAGKTLDRIAVVKGQIRIAGSKPSRTPAGRAPAGSVQGRPMDLVTELRKAAEHGPIDCPIKIRIKRGASSVARGRRQLARADRTRWTSPSAPCSVKQSEVRPRNLEGALQ